MRSARVRDLDTQKAKVDWHSACSPGSMKSNLALRAGLGAFLFTASLVGQISRPYRVIDLGVPIGQSPMAGVTAERLSPSGEYVGGWSVWEPYVWQRGVGMLPLQKLPNYRTAGVNDVNDAGIGIGRCGLSTSWELYQACFWDSSGAVTSLTQPAFQWSIGLLINGRNDVVLLAGIGGSTKALLGPLRGPYTEIVPGAVSTSAYDLNELGQICLYHDDMYSRYTPGLGLETMPFRVRRLNDYGQVVGLDLNNPTVVRHTDGFGLETLPAPVDIYDVGAVDSFGQICAMRRVRTQVSPPNYDHFAYLFPTGRTPVLLQDLVSHTTSVRVDQVVGISDGGVIAAYGSIGPDNHAMLLEHRYLHVYGSGCAGGNGQVRAVAFGEPIGGGRVNLLAAGGRSGGVGAFVLSANSASLPLPGGCTALVDPTVALVLLATTNSVGQSRVEVQIPVGTRAGSVFAQFVSVDPQAANGTLALSNGVRIDLQ